MQVKVGLNKILEVLVINMSVTVRNRNTYFRVLLIFNIFLRGWIPVLLVALINGVNFAPRLNPHVLVS